MQIFDWPDALRPSGVDWGLFVPQLVSRSAFDGTAEAESLGPPRWFFTITTGPLRRTEVPDWDAFLDRLNGGINRVRTWDWRREAALSPGNWGTPSVRVAGSGSTLQTQGWTLGMANVLRAGSYIGINGEVKRLSTTISSGNDGRATITFAPPTRAPVPAGVVLVLTKPPATFMCTTERPSMPQQGARHPGLSLSFMEDFQA